MAGKSTTTRDFNRARGFHHLDRAIAAAREAGIYVILDLHAAPGWQNEHWHSDNAHGVSLLWHDRNYQIRGRELWRHIARHYRGEPAVAGYNLLNEPNAPSIQMLNDLYNEWIAAIREVDPDHIVFLEGNNFSRDFAGLEVDFKDNIVFSSHNYTIVTHRARMYPGWIGDLYVDRSFMERTFLEVSRWLIEQDHPAWVGVKSRTVCKSGLGHATVAAGETSFCAALCRCRSSM
ncbi:hypothetical protein E1B22_01260 [Thermaerobacter sp. FW80]|uniref:glycoside hydrolase family 5 protein n=1 Tax=Thermaerobacter sp. FW80 TaxID=2546351 RepID=UPI0010756D54|nr:cellulase family glycosylhydrolase [Thermaerobacter sp. FW80]QBS36728.1 hypothetical protein E1B22_01260 [Thermaerobacter sp. FW80]